MKAAVLCLAVLLWTPVQAQDLAPVQWPDGFADTPLELAASESIRVNDVELLVRHPMDWTVLDKTTANVQVEGGIVTLHHPSSSLFLTVMAPRAWTSGALGLMTAGQLDAIVGALDPSLPLKPLSRGQAWKMGDPIWFWVEYIGTLPGFSERVPRRLLESLGGFSSAHVWGFFGVTGGQFVNVNCAAAERSGESEADRSKRFAQIGVACRAMLRQMSIRPTSHVQSDPISPNRRVVASNCLTAPCTSTVTDGSPLNLSETITAADGSTLTFAISAVSTFAELSAAASAKFKRLTPGTGATFVSAQMTDALTVDFAPLTGTTGFLTINYALDGSISESGIVNSEAQVAILVDRDGFGTGVLPENWASVYSSSVSGVFSTTPFSFVYGQGFNLAMHLNLALGTVAFGGTPISLTAPVSGSGEGSADFANRLRIASVSLFDASMTPVYGASVTRGSGTK